MTKPQGSGADEMDEAGDGAEGSGKPSALDEYCVNLNQKASEGRIDPLIGRDEEVERTIQVLCRRTKNNPLFVGDPGVGKTALLRVWPSVLWTRTSQKY